jgi:hypothetical protein
VTPKPCQTPLQPKYNSARSLPHPPHATYGAGRGRARL